MDIRNQILQEHTKQNALLISNYIGSDNERFDELMQLFFNDNVTVTQRAAWTMCLSVEKNTELISPYLEKMLKLLSLNVHDAIKRNIVRIMQDIELPEDLMGLAFENCYQLVLSKSSAIAIKAFSITVLYNICKKEPELKHELSELIKLQLEGASSGLKNRCLKTLKLLDKL